MHQTSGETRNTREVAIVMYHIGLMQDQVERSGVPDDVDHLLEIAEGISEDWANFRDIRNFGEEGYIGEYAARRLSENFGTTKGEK